MSDSTRLALSDTWREIRSQDKGIELASLLHAAKIMTQTLIPKSEVFFAGQPGASTDGTNVYVSAEGLDGFPISGDQVDYFLGTTLHEVGHILFSPNKFKLTHDVYNTLKGLLPMSFVALTANAVEDLIINALLSAFPGYKEYLHRSIDKDLEALASVLPAVYEPLSGAPTRKEFLNAFFLIALKGQIPPDITPQNAGLIAQMLRVVGDMTRKKITRERGLIQILKLFQGLPEKHPITGESPGQDKQVGKTPEGKTGDKKPECEPIQSDEDSEGPERTEMPTPVEIKPAEDEPPDIISAVNPKKVDIDPKLAKEVAETIVENRQDLTQMTSALAERSYTTIILHTPRNKENLEQIRQKTSPVEEKLRRIFQQFRDRRTEYYRGLYSGKLSTRRLHRTGYGDERVFQRKDRPEEMGIALCLLMDCSGSMYGLFPIISEITTALSDAFVKEKALYMCLGYSESGVKVNLARFYDVESGLNLGYEKLGDGTPSYEALAAAAAELLRFGGNKKKILIHYTDGFPNNRAGIPDLLKKIRGMGIRDFHFGPGDLAKGLYGNLQVVGGLEELPAYIESILREAL